MLTAYRALSTGQPMDEQALAKGIANAAAPTLIGLIACPIGIAIIVTVIIKRIRLRKCSIESTEETKPFQQGGPGYPPQGVGSPDP